MILDLLGFVAILALLPGGPGAGLPTPAAASVLAPRQSVNRVPPSQGQVIDQRDFNALDSVAPPTEANASTIFLWPGITVESLVEKPFHIYDDEFYGVIGDNPTFTVIASSPIDPLFHEAVVWYPPTDEVFFTQNAGAKDAGTGLNKSAIIQKISLAQADAVKGERNASGKVDVTTVPSTPQVVNPNGATNYKNQIIYAAQGQGDLKPSSLTLMNPEPPYNTTVLVNNFFGRQFNSLNDVDINPRNGDVYFTDVTYAYYQGFRPKPGLRKQVYRWNEKTGALMVVADGFSMPNGITFAPDGRYAYVTDTGTYTDTADFSEPASIYRYDVTEDGRFKDRITFAYASPGIPDGIHCDAKGNVYSGCGDGIHVWNPSGKLIGKIYTGSGVANFQFAGKGRMVICGETQLYYATLAAEGASIS